MGEPPDYLSKDKKCAVWVNTDKYGFDYLNVRINDVLIPAFKHPYPKKHYVYILDCVRKNGKEVYYTGMTHNLAERWMSHSSVGGKVKWMRRSAITPHRVVYYEVVDNESEARKREKQIKAMGRQKKDVLVYRFLRDNDFDGGIPWTHIQKLK